MSIARLFPLWGENFRTLRPLAGAVLLALAGLGLLPAADAATGQTLTVTTNTDSGAGSLRAAITQANADTNDTITFGAAVVSPITLTSGELLITGGVTITGPGATTLTISGNNASRVFHVSSGVVSISGLTVTAGKVANNGGGGILVDSAAALTVSACALTANASTFGGNNAPPGDRGGAISNNGVLTVTGSTFSTNTAATGGAIYNSAGMTVSSSTFTSNTASFGGAVFNTGGVSASLTTVTFSSNTAGVGGAVYSGSGTVNPNAVLTIRGGTFAGNTALGNASGTTNGGGAINTLVSLNLAGCTFAGNTTNALNGGALGVSGGTTTASGCTFSSNTASVSGGGLGVTAGATANLTNDTISGNTASSGNGGGIDSAGTLSLTSVTVASNTASSGTGGGIAAEAGGTATLQGTIDATNTAGASPDAVGAFTSSGSNSIGDATGATGFTSPHDQTGTAGAVIDPQLGPLTDNGGPTPTRAIASTSLALNADYSANAPATDQRGTTRPIGARADIGAFEAPSPPGAPFNLSAAAGFERITLTFIGTFDATGYNVYRGTTPGGEDLANPINGRTPLRRTRFTDLNVTNGVTYYYVVEGVNGAGSSAPSNEASATPQDTRVRGTVLAWGDNTTGDLGTGDFIRSLNPKPITAPSGQAQPLANVVQVAAGAGFSLSLTADGTVYAWGDDSYGQLGDGNFSSQGTVSRRTTPAVVQSINGGALRNVVAIAAGREFGLALTANGTVYAWGRNEAGQLGNGTSDSSGSGSFRQSYASPVLAGSRGVSLTGAIAIAAGGFHSLAVMQDGSVLAWGSNSVGQLGNGTSGPGTDSVYPTPVSNLTNATLVAAGQYHSLSLDATGNVTAWGYDQDGELGDGSFGNGNQPTPQTVFLNSQTGAAATQIVAGQYHSLALMSDGSVIAWGSDSNGQIGNGTTNSYGSYPFQALPGGIVSLGAGGAFSQALTAIHTLDVFGANAGGQLGNGTTTDRSTPVNTLTAAGTIQPSLYAVAAGATHALAIQNLPPVAIRQAYTVSQSGRTVGATGGLLTGAADAENDGPLLAVPFTSRATPHGTVTVRADGSFTYTPTAGYQGADVFTYQISDGLALSAPATVTLTVTTLTLKSLAITPLAPSVAEKGTVQFHVNGTYNDGSQQDFTGAANWTSTDPTVASISNVTPNNGLATASATKPGTVTITATYSGLSAATTLSVTRSLKTITVTPANPNLDKGRTLPFTATASYTDGTTTDVTQQVAWSTSNSQVVTISNSAGTRGVATGQGVSTAAIVATDPATGITGTTSISVTQAVLTSITVTPANVTLASGGTRPYAATGVFSDGTTQNYTQAVTWGTNNPNVATVDVSGVVTAVGVGSTQVTATATATDSASGKPFTVVGATGVTVVNPSAVPHNHVVFNLNGGQVSLWDVDTQGNVNEHLYGPYFDAPSNPKAPWTITAVASAPNGTQRLLWNNTDARVALWSVDTQGNILSVAGYGPYTDGAAQNVWHAVAISVGPDNVTHILWDNTDHRIAFWNVDSSGSLLSAVSYGPYTDNGGSYVWDGTALATGPDGTSRILWNHTDGRVAVWTVDSQGGLLGIAGYGPFAGTSPSNLWSATAVSVGTDGTTHLIWNNPDGHVAFWNIDGSGNYVLAGYGPFTGFTARAVSTDPQNVSHILWGRADGMVSLWDVRTSDFSFNYHNYAPGAGYTSVALSSGP